MKKSDPPIIVTKEIKASITEVWNAITQVDQMTQWFFANIPDFKPEVGFETQFKVSTRERDFLHLWRIEEVVPYEKIRYNWKYEGYEGDSFLTFSLSELNNITTITATCQILENFPQDIPEFKRESCIGGWEYFWGELKTFLEK